MPDTVEKTNCYTYKVELVIQILAKDSMTAARKLDAEGGYVTARKITLLETVPLINGEKKES